MTIQVVMHKVVDMKTKEIFGGPYLNYNLANVLCDRLTKRGLKVMVEKV